jgi:hypothetical protein
MLKINSKNIALGELIFLKAIFLFPIPTTNFADKQFGDGY